MVQKLLNSKAKDSEIVANPLCLGNISEAFSVAHMKKTGLYDSVFDFRYYKYLMKKNGI